MPICGKEKNQEYRRNGKTNNKLLLPRWLVGGDLVAAASGVVFWVAVGKRTGKELWGYAGSWRKKALLEYYTYSVLAIL